jgi:hypothetical protein
MRLRAKARHPIDLTLVHPLQPQQSSSPLAVRDVTIKVGDTAVEAVPPAAMDVPLALGGEESLKVRPLA